MKKNKANHFALTGRTIVVTGAAGLLGVQHCKAIATFGGLPVLLDINGNKLLELREELKQIYGLSCPHYQLDISDENQVRECAEDFERKYKNLHGLVNNAAIDAKVTQSGDQLNHTRLENFPLERWRKELDVGLTGSLLCIKYFGALIARNESGGSIVNISSDLGLIAPDQRLYSDPSQPKEEQNVKPVTYSVIKTGLIGLSRYVATYWAESNVRCNTLCPAGVFNDQPSEFVEKLISRIPMGRMADRNEYEGSLVFLLSDASKYMTGSILTIDGGRSCW